MLLPAEVMRRIKDYALCDRQECVYTVHRYATLRAVSKAFQRCFDDPFYEYANFVLSRNWHLDELVMMGDGRFLQRARNIELRLFGCPDRLDLDRTLLFLARSHSLDSLVINITGQPPVVKRLVMFAPPRLESVEVSIQGSSSVLVEPLAELLDLFRLVPDVHLYLPSLKARHASAEPVRLPRLSSLHVKIADASDRWPQQPSGVNMPLQKLLTRRSTFRAVIVSVPAESMTAVQAQSSSTFWNNYGNCRILTITSRLSSDMVELPPVPEAGSRQQRRLALLAVQIDPSTPLANAVSALAQRADAVSITLDAGILERFTSGSSLTRTAALPGSFRIWFVAEHDGTRRFDSVDTFMAWTRTRCRELIQELERAQVDWCISPELLNDHPGNHRLELDRAAADFAARDAHICSKVLRREPCDTSVHMYPSS